MTSRRGSDRPGQRADRVGPPAGRRRRPTGPQKAGPRPAGPQPAGPRPAAPRPLGSPSTPGSGGQRPPGPPPPGRPPAVDSAIHRIAPPRPRDGFGNSSGKSGMNSGIHRRPGGPLGPGPAPRPPRRRPLKRTSSLRRLNVTLLSFAFAISLIVGRLIQLQGLESGKLPDAQPEGANGDHSDPRRPRRDQQQRRNCARDDRADR